MNFKTKNLLIFFFFAVQLIFAQQAAFKASVSKNKLGLNQRFRIEFDINVQGADNFTPPSFANFTVISGPSQSVNQTWMNGKVTFSQRYIYTLQPKKMGNLTVGSATIEYNGNLLKTKPVKISVTKEVEVPADPNNPDYIADQNIHLVAEVSNTKPYIGEAITVVYKILVSEKIIANNLRERPSQQFNGFWHQNIELKNQRVQETMYNGERYRYLIVKKDLLIPQKSGKLYIDPFKMGVTVGVPTGRGDFFGNMITRNIAKELTTKKRLINVQELPVEGQPENFTGAVGDFTYKMTANRTRLKENSSAEIKVQVTGKGNLNLFELPKITTSEELEVYTPTRADKVRPSGNTLSGRVSDTYVVVPEYKGKYKISETSFSYFNPKDKKYHTITAAPIFIESLGGTPKAQEEKPVETKKDILANNDNNFKDIETKTKFFKEDTSDFYNSTLYYILIIIPLLAIPVGIIIGNRKQARDADVEGKRLRRANKLAKKYLSDAKKQLGKKEEFYVALEKALHNFLKAKLKIETTDISKEKIADILRSKDVDAVVIQEFITVLDDCDFARFTPTTNVMMQKEFDKAKDLIIKLDKAL
ncbi:BatD family protein [Aureivirga sp. CE67]|uniref:BatD family protein n=1 Tax=Aureivirga sp. CE67 TaxID=1788983 RepID=UPI0018C94190|nr:BatD family protein [Aureivirga sp. CE67]